MGLDSEDIALLQLGGLIQSAIGSYITHRQEQVPGVEAGLPSHVLFDARRTLLAAAGKLTELASDPQDRLLEVAIQYNEARCLHIAVDKRVPDILHKRGSEGTSIASLAEEIKIEPRKLSRVMRSLCSIHIFEEIAEDVFRNNSISASLVDNEPLRAYIMIYAYDPYSASDYLPRTLCDPVKGASYDVAVTPFQDAVNTTKPRWEWLEEKVKASDLLQGRNGTDGGISPYPGVFKHEFSGDNDEQLVPRPEHALFGLAMLGGGRVFGRAHIYDFPWASLGNGTVVDVGGGVGGFSLQLSRINPDLNFVIQDRAPVLAQAESTIWPRENPEALTAGRVRFMPHDFFEQQPVKNADVYWMRYILHDWSDEYCVRILAAVKTAMGPRSRILICDQVMNTTVGCPELTPAPAPLPANWGYHTRFSHQRDLTMMSIINGIERKPAEFRDLIQRAGLKLRKFWDCRSQVGLVEVVLPDSELL